jgi:large subunit ribosomal protein L4e
MTEKAKIPASEDDKGRTKAEKKAEGKDLIGVKSLDGKILREINIPNVFKTIVRPDVIKRAVLAVQSTRIQPKGRDPMAGKRTTAESFGVGRGIARIPRVKGRGTARAGQGAFAPGTIGGRVAHPPLSNKNIVKRINAKERRLAVRSAIAATAHKELVQQRGHTVQKIKQMPLVVDDKIEKLKTAKKLVETLKAIGLDDELNRIESGNKTRAGKGKLRGRRTKHIKGPLIVVNDDKEIRKAASNIPGLDVSHVTKLNAELLAPGAHLGRITVWGETAFKRLEEVWAE